MDYLGPGATVAGVLALRSVCTHDPNPAEWLPDFEFTGHVGWFRCPACQGTFTRAGIRAFGPPPRSLDTYSAAFDGDGALVIDLADLHPGADDNALRAIPVQGV